MTTTATPPARTAVRRAAPRDRRRRHGREALTAYLLVAPALALYAVFMVVPVVGTAVLGFFDWSGINLSTLEFVGLDNYRALAADPVFWRALTNNLLFIVLGMTGSVALGLLLAVLLDRRLRGSAFFRGAYFAPTAISTVVVGAVFALLLSPEFGVVNRGLEAVGLDPPAWLGDPRWALPAVIAVEVWRQFGFAMFLFIAGLQDIGTEITEAARLDGADGWQTFRYVTFPMLRPVTLLVATLVGISTLKLFDLVYVMTSGGPGEASQVIALYMYEQGFQFRELGYASSVAVSLLVLTAVLTLVRFRLLPDRDTR
jgi:multiple sugar transport system permease protein